MAGVNKKCYYLIKFLLQKLHYLILYSSDDSVQRKSKKKKKSKKHSKEKEYKRKIYMKEDDRNDRDYDRGDRDRHPTPTHTSAAPDTAPGRWLRRSTI